MKAKDRMKSKAATYSVTWSENDNRFDCNLAFATATDFFSYMKDSFDMLYNNFRFRMRCRQNGRATKSQSNFCLLSLQAVEGAHVRTVKANRRAHP